MQFKTILMMAFVKKFDCACYDYENAKLDNLAAVRWTTHDGKYISEADNCDTLSALPSYSLT